MSAPTVKSFTPVVPEWWGDSKPYKIMDCVEGIKTLPDNSIGLMVTSPPYNIGLDYGEYKDRRPLNAYVDWLAGILNSFVPKLVPGGHIALNIQQMSIDPGSGHRSARVPYPSLVIGKMWPHPELEYRGEIIWDKGQGVIGGGTTWGSWRSPNMPALRDAYECILVWRKPGARKGTTDLTAEEFPGLTCAVWHVQPETRDVGHPAPYPVTLIERLVRLYTFKEEIVFDPFLGSGTTILAARRQGRIGLGFELDPKYASVIERRCLVGTPNIEEFLTTPVEPEPASRLSPAC